LNETFVPKDRASMRTALAIAAAGCVLIAAAAAAGAVSSPGAEARLCQVVATPPASSPNKTGAGIGGPGSCPRPADQYGVRYQISGGAYQSRGRTPGGGKFVTILADGAAPVSVTVTDDLFRAAGALPPGARVTLVGYIQSSMSGSQPPFACAELAVEPGR